MEEKLYFKPEASKKKKEKKNHKILKLVVVLLILLVLTLVIIWLLKGMKTVSGRYPENVKNEYLDCTAEETVYPKIGEVGEEKNELKATMIFFGEEELSSISIKYTLEFKDKEAANYAEPIVNTRFHERLAQVIDQYGAFNNKVTLLDDTIMVTLHAEKNDLTELSKEFFLIKKTDELVTLADFRENFEKQGLVCKSSIDNN
ncbi:hypothetical protein IJG71_02490 [Candidatus Saccharibacteria bacterium]|nr:hypothetical protein [Candidatus Saccharibacteria bacterium]